MNGYWNRYAKNKNLILAPKYEIEYIISTEKSSLEVNQHNNFNITYTNVKILNYEKWDSYQLGNVTGQIILYEINSHIWGRPY